MKARVLTVILLIAVPVLSVYAVERAKGIPGVDPLELAKDGPASSGNTNDNNALTDSAAQADPSDPGYPRIRNITVRPDPSEKNTARITWEAHPDLSTPVYVVRFTRPISTKEVLMESYAITTPPLKSGERAFVDRDLPQGAFYYAVVSTFELGQEGRLELRKGQNYTGVPFMVYRDGTEEADGGSSGGERPVNLDETDFVISGLTALNTEKSVVLNWKKLKIPDVRYTVYRSSKPLDSPERMQEATRLGTAQEHSPYFEDNNPVQGSRVYYGVGVTDLRDNTDYTRLRFERSYIDHVYQKPERKLQYEPFLPDSLMAYQVNKNTIRLLWVDPGPSVTGYSVYRASRPIQDETALKESLRLGSAVPGGNGFTDTGLPPGQYFYALIPKDQNGRDVAVLRPGRTFTTFSVGLRGPRSSADTGSEEAVPAEVDLISGQGSDLVKVLQDLKAKSDSEGITIEWDFRDDVSTESVRILVYRANQPIRSPQEIRDHGNFVNDVPVEARRIRDERLGTGHYYFAIVEKNPLNGSRQVIYSTPSPLSLAKGESEKEKPETTTDTTKTEPEKEKPSQKVTETDLRTVLSRTYARQRYAEAVDQLDLLLLEAENREIRAKIQFYRGISLYHVERYDDALKCFLNRDVKKLFPERTEFWYRRTLERSK